jgi:hypothetical protein
MGINVSCGACGKGFRVKEGLAGQTAKCPFCSGPIKVPPSTTAAIAVGQAGAIRKDVPTSKAAAAIAAGGGRKVSYTRPRALVLLAVLNLAVVTGALVLLLGAQSPLHWQIVKFAGLGMLALAAVGYLVMHRFLGYVMGNLAVVVCLAGCAGDLLTGNYTLANMLLPAFVVVSLGANLCYRGSFR